MIEEKKKDETNINETLKNKIIAEHEGNWIQHNVDGDCEWYDLFLIDNTMVVSMSSEAFTNLRALFKMLNNSNDKTKYVS